MLNSPASLLLIVALVLTVVHMAQSGVRSVLGWAVLFVVLALLYPSLR